jgi:hypothetical protein
MLFRRGAQTEPEEYDDDQLTPEERDKLIDELARKVVGRRMETPVIMFLEMHKPVTFLASQSILVASPFLVPLFGAEGVQKYSRLFSSVDNVELLIERIEELSDKK